MKFLTPLGLLGLLGLLILILIYILKPNYQVKYISSTFIWKLSQNKKRKLPISKLRNILLIICQFLIVISCALILAQPNKIIKSMVDGTEVIVILDSSASMRAKSNNESRFQRAVRGITELSDGVWAKKGIVSVIAAQGDSWIYEAFRVTAENNANVKGYFDELVKNEDDMACSYGAQDLDRAVELCQDVLNENPRAQIYLYTDTKYAYVPKNIALVDVSREGEWNGAILDASTSIEDNYCVLSVDVGCYGRNNSFELNVTVSGVNSMDNEELGENLEFTLPVELSNGIEKTLVFRKGGRPSIVDESDDANENVEYYDLESDLGKDCTFYSYQTIHLTLTSEGEAYEQDSFPEDDNFDIYGGQKEVLRVQYSSSMPNKFVRAALAATKNGFVNDWDIQITELQPGTNPELTGYDFYIFEHKMPAELPTDGVVFLFDPDPQYGSLPVSSGLRLNGTVGPYKNGNVFREMYWWEAESHSLTERLPVDELFVTKYQKIDKDAATKNDYQVLLEANDDPILLIKNTETSKLVVMPFSIHFSNISKFGEWPLFMRDLFDYFIPSTVNGHTFSVNEKIELNARGETLTVSRNGELLNEYSEFPASFTAVVPGSYNLSQETYFGKSLSENIFVKVPASESNICSTASRLPDPPKGADESEFYKDLLFYLALALVAALFVEWILQAKDNM